jgi:hypothetical protein
MNKAIQRDVKERQVTKSAAIVSGVIGVRWFFS